MSIRTVEAAIRHARSVITEWEEAGFGPIDWMEVHTRYAVIDPVIKALGWNISDPRECHPEYPRHREGEQRTWADYALFGGQASAPSGIMKWRRTCSSKPRAWVQGWSDMSTNSADMLRKPIPRCEKV